MGLFSGWFARKSKSESVLRTRGHFIGTTSSHAKTGDQIESGGVQRYV